MKKLLSSLIILMLLMSISAIAAGAESASGFYTPSKPMVVGSETYTFVNSDSWEEIYVYAYNNIINWFDSLENAPYPDAPANYEYADGRDGRLSVLNTTII